MVPELVAYELPWRFVIACHVERTRLHQRDALLVVHHMQRFALQRDRVRTNCAIMLAEELKGAQVDALLGKPRSLLPHLAHALPRGVVYIEGSTATTEIGLLQLILVVPVHV